jgi:hypothetical protein
VLAFGLDDPSSRMSWGTDWSRQSGLRCSQDVIHGDGRDPRGGTPLGTRTTTVSAVLAEPGHIAAGVGEGSHEPVAANVASTMCASTQRSHLGQLALIAAPCR